MENLDKTYINDYEDIGNQLIDKDKYYDYWLKNNLDNIKNNENLMDIIIKITNYSILLNMSEIRYLTLASLISSDYIVDIKTANEALDNLQFIKKYVDLFNISDEIKKEVIKYVNKGIKIVKQELKNF